MRSDATEFQLERASSLRIALARMAEKPGRYVPMAGGTELMVAFNTGRLQSPSLLSIHGLRELRFIKEEGERIHLGAGTTFTDIRRSELIARTLPLLVEAASWTGSVANQNRGTVGGNVCNASPAADTPPALLAYDADVTLVSAAGERTLPYREFHLGYKRTALRSDELLYSISIKPPAAGVCQSIRKVGTRKAQAISKVALAGVAAICERTVQEIRLGAASVADRPVRLLGTEDVLRGASLSTATLDETVRLARSALAAEIRPIDDIRSTALYRRAVAGNLLEAFLRGLVVKG